MVEVASRELRNDTAGLLRKVEAGETIVITRRGKPVADLVPHQESDQRWLSPGDVVEIREISAADPTFGSFLKQLDEEGGDLEPIP
jgi:prevent-host-death family protein